jgi:hypothetical protein
LFSEYRILGKKGEGTFSEVLKCQNIKDGSYWACKKMKQTYERYVLQGLRLARKPSITFYKDCGWLVGHS